MILPNKEVINSNAQEFVKTISKLPFRNANIDNNQSNPNIRDSVRTIQKVFTRL